jgi:phospholipase C
MRVPAVIASPFTRGDPANPRVSSRVFDHTSILKLIEWRWHLKPLTARDARHDVGNLVEALDFDAPDDEVPALPVPPFPVITPCVPEIPVPGKWQALLDLFESLLPAPGAAGG